MSNWRVGVEHVVAITGLTHEGMGVGRIDNRVVFVPQAIPGDQVRLRLVHVKERLAYGELLRVVEPSPQRRAPSCPHALLCGGCQLQHMDYAAQLRWKRQQVVDALERLGGLEVEVLATLGMADPYHYRNKAQLPLGRQGGQLVMGFFQRGSHDIVDLHTCEIQHPLITKLALAVKRAAGELGIEPYDEVRHSGVLRHAVIRVSFAQGKLMLILVTRTRELPHSAELLARLTREIPELVSVVHNINPRVTNVILGRETQVLWGEEHLLDAVGHLRYAISPLSFFQVNPVQTRVLYDLVRQNLRLTGAETVLDLYCGAGTIGLYVAAQAGQVIGVESVSAAVEDARRNAELNGIANAEFHVGRAEEELPKLIQKHTAIDAAIVDPPRKGCDAAVLRALSAAGVPRLVYVSCNPSTLARDLSQLAGLGYRLGPVQPVDMFPWTRHVECVVLMSKVEK